ncbi:hypothetical protein [Streptomyces sp. NPDC051776]|uniref:hypothetical protein n=1 Tax=Streptomyces sp. NPDC051776 TaxID=3155414 RepID=UPI00341D7BC3
MGVVIAQHPHPVGEKLRERRRGPGRIPRLPPPVGELPRTARVRRGSNYEIRLLTAEAEHSTAQHST